jgi:hypothetical protein
MLISYCCGDWQSGWPDWANFCPLGDWLLWVFCENSTDNWVTFSTINIMFFPQRWIGLFFGLLCIWSPCWQYQGPMFWF